MKSLLFAISLLAASCAASPAPAPHSFGATLFSPQQATARSLDTTLRSNLAVRAEGLIAQTFDRNAGITAALTVDGTVYFTALPLVAGDVVTNVVYFITTAGSGTSLSKVGIYDRLGNRLALSADQGAAWNTVGMYTIPMIAPYTVPSSGLYYLAVVAKTATTMPAGVRASQAGVSTPTAGFPAAIGSGAPAFWAQTGQTDLPATATISNAGISIAMWMGVNWVEHGEHQSLPRHMTHSLFQYGALGTIVLAVLIAIGWLLHLFVPIWIQHFKDDQKALRDLTSAQQQMVGTMVDLRNEMKRDHEEQLGAISVAKAKRRWTRTTTGEQMSDEATNDDDGSDRRVVPINEYQRRLCDSLIELATLGERVTSFARVLHGAARDGDVSQFPAIRAVNKRIRENLVRLDALMLEVERTPPT